MVEAGVDSVEHGCGLSLDLIDRMAVQGIALVPTMLNIETQFESIVAQAEAKYPRYSGHMRRLARRVP